MVIIFVTADTFKYSNPWNVAVMMGGLSSNGKNKRGKKGSEGKENLEFLKLFAKKLNSMLEFGPHV